MIKLELTEKPEKLTDKLEQQLVNEFKESGQTKPVWNKKFIKEALMNLSHNKCAYSEIVLGEESKYMEIDHFKFKHKYPDEVVKWGNLLPSCKTCNLIKGSWDVAEKPIINPLIDNPQNHLFVEAFKFGGKDQIGKDTIKALGLNDRSNFMNPRSGHGRYVSEIINFIYEKIENADNESKKKKISVRLKKLLQDCDSSHAYSAVISTHILYELPKYNEIKKFLISNSLWDNELETLEKELKKIALPKN